MQRKIWTTIPALCGLLLTPGWIVPSHAQSRFEETTVGAWRVYEYIGHMGERRPKGIPNMAETSALDDGRKASLGIEECSTYSVYFRFEGDAQFNDAKKDVPELSTQERVIFSKVEGSGPARYPDGLPVLDGRLRPMILTGGDADYFLTYAEALMRGTNLMICPTKDDKNPACLQFSLRGITAALKMVCPKR